MASTHTRQRPTSASCEESGMLLQRLEHVKVDPA